MPRIELRLGRVCITSKAVSNDACAGIRCLASSAEALWMEGV
ncbi:hypothetical protein [Myxococcus xanthus]|nr:hypothetical protein [Myxococcus xanthus]